MYNLKNKNLFSDDILEINKNKKYYYDFGTGNKEVKKENDAFLEGFNSVETVKKNEKETDMLHQKDSERKNLSFNPAQEVKTEKFSYNPQKPLTFVQYAKGETNNPWGLSLGGDLKSDKDKELFLKGFVTQNENHAENATRKKSAKNTEEEGSFFSRAKDTVKDIAKKGINILDKGASGQVLFGAFGTSPFKIGNYFKKKGYSVETYEGDKEILNAEIPDADTYIMSFWNGDTLSSMIHTVSFDKLDNGGYRIYNSKGRRVDDTHSLNAYFTSNNYIPLVLHCIKKG